MFGKFIFVFFVCVFGNSFSFSQEFLFLQNTEKSITLSFLNKGVFTKNFHDSIEYNSKVYFKPRFSTRLLEKGNPDLPIFSTNIKLPEKGSYLVKLNPKDSIIITNKNILPSKGNVKRNQDIDSLPYVFSEVYLKDEFFPNQILKNHYPFLSRNDRGLVLSICPIRYNPIQEKVIIYTKIEIIVELLQNTKGLNEVEFDVSTKKKSTVSFINFVQPKTDVITETDDLLIIGKTTFFDSIQNYINWKKQLGLTVYTKSLEEIGSSPLQIKNFITSFYLDHPDLSSVLLLGDHEDLPAYSYGLALGEDLWSDSYYGQLLGEDFFPELLIGRFSGNTSQIKVMADRTIEYEKNPSQGSWYLNALGMASNQGEFAGDNGESDWQHLRNIREKLIDFGYQSVFELYDGSQGEVDEEGDPNGLHTMPALNNGISLFNYTGHGSNNIMFTGSFTSLNVNQATNVGKYPFVISVACNNGTFPEGGCLAENFLRAKTNEGITGAIGFAGSSILMSWAPPMFTQDAITKFVVEEDVSYNPTSLGGMFYNAQQEMLTAYGVSPEAIEVMQTWILFGDPTVDLRNRIPVDISSNYSLIEEEKLLKINSNIVDARLTIDYHGEIILDDYFVNGDFDWIYPDSLIDKNVIVTLSKRNHRAFQKEIKLGKLDEVISEEIIVYPNPSTDGKIILKGNKLANSTIRISDINGKIIVEQPIYQQESEIDLSAFDKGFYVLSVYMDSEFIESFRIVIL